MRGWRPKLSLMALLLLLLQSGCVGLTTSTWSTPPPKNCTNCPSDPADSSWPVVFGPVGLHDELDTGHNRQF